MSIRSMIKIIAVCILTCAGMVTVMIVWLSPKFALPEEIDWSVTPTIPVQGYQDIQAVFSTRHKAYDPNVQQIIQQAGSKDDKELFTPGIHLDIADMQINDCYSDLSKELNTYLYAICVEYASGIKVNDIELSPLLVLAEANQEGGNVDRSKTFSSLAYSATFDWQSVQELASMNVTSVLRDSDTWHALSNEYSTRDRGALQCNPNYSGNDTRYGKSEHMLLDEWVAENPVPDWGTENDAVGNVFTVQQWMDYSRVKYGDRFNPASMVMMFADEKRNVEAPRIAQLFPDIQNEYEVYAIMAYNHWCGNGFMTMDNDTPYAGFQTIGRAKEYCHDLASPKAIELIYTKVLQDIQTARQNGTYPPKTLDKNTGRAVFDMLHEAGAVQEWDYYFRHKVMSNGWDQGRTACSYPLALIYGVMQMNLLYSGY